MSSGNFPHGVNHSHHHQAEGERNAHVRYDAAAGIVDDNGAGPRENEGERADKFGHEFFQEHQQHPAFCRAEGWSGEGWLTISDAWLATIWRRFKSPRKSSFSRIQS